MLFYDDSLYKYVVNTLERVSLFGTICDHMVTSPLAANQQISVCDF